MKLHRTLIIPLLTLAACEEPDAGPTLAAPTGGARLALYGVGDLARAHPGQPCAAGRHREFDFWLGQWNVFAQANGALAGTNIVRGELDGCVVSESWTGAGGIRGRSINTYDGDTGRWHQTWVPAGPGALRLTGGFDGEKMEMTGHRVSALTGNVIDDQWRWEAFGADTVRQTGITRVNGNIVGNFVGVYHRADTVTPAPETPTQFCTVQFPAARQLDFWVGEWSVEGENGQPLGESTVSLDLSGCLVEERFATPRGYRSVSFAYRDVIVGKWFRTLIDSEGERVELEGGLVDGRLVLTGVESEPGVGAFHVRVTLEPVDPTHVRQTWETSRDDGATWRTDLAVVYVRR